MPAARKASGSVVTPEVPLEEPATPGNGAQGPAMLEAEFDEEDLHALREAVLTRATAAGMPESRAIEVMLVVNELASNAIRHGGGIARLQIRIAAGALHCQVSDPGIARSNGHPPSATPDQRPASPSPEPAPWPRQPGHGLWMVQQAADEFTVTTGPDGTQVSVSFTPPGAS